MGEEGETGIEIKTAMNLNCTSKVVTIIVIVAHLFKLFCRVVQYRQATSLGKYENISTISSGHACDCVPY